MKNKNTHSDMPIGKVTRVPDFLPSPAELSAAEENVKITILLKKSSVEFFKKVAAKHHTKYQKMMREVLDLYALKHGTA